MKEEVIKVLKFEVGQEPYLKEIINELKHLQSEVDGLIQIVPLSDDCLVVLNEEGKLNGLKPNRWLGSNDIICGDFFICGDAGDTFKSIEDADIRKCQLFFMKKAEFTGEEPELEPRAEVMGFDLK